MTSIRRAVNAEVGAMGPPLPVPIHPQDFRAVCAEYVARFNRLFMNLERELDDVRLVYAEVEVTRAYSDILDRQATTAVLVTKMMDSAARLGIAESLEGGITASIEFQRMALDILAALEPHPEARTAVLRAIGGGPEINGDATGSDLL